MKSTDLMGKGLRSFEKSEPGKMEGADLPDMENAEAQEETSITVEAPAAGSEGGEGLMQCIQVVSTTPTDLYNGRIWMESSS